ncbi:MAG: hypothetical protein VCD00_13185 [Candidatus Hydrogenedentota bacterium]
MRVPTDLDPDEQFRVIIADIGDDFNLDTTQIPDDVDVSIVPHLFGKTAALTNTSHVIEDIAQSIGGPTGRASTLAIASFYATKLITPGKVAWSCAMTKGLRNTFATDVTTIIETPWRNISRIR